LYRSRPAFGSTSSLTAEIIVTHRIAFLTALWLLCSGAPVLAQTEPSAPEPGLEPAPDEAVAAELPADEAAAAGVAEVSTELGADEAAELPSEPLPDDDIIVTGSRIKTTFGGSAAPVEVVDRKQLRQSGITNLTDVVQNLSASQGSGAQGSFGIGAAGGAASSINLRGLGPVATLLLLNGRRLTPSGSPAVVGLNDLSVIPLAAVERIEILKAGAAAIYGADAVGGVVNIITRRKFDGARVELTGQTTSRFDQADYTGSASFGAVSERSRVLAAASYFRRSELLANERDLPADKFVAPNNSSIATYTATTPGSLPMVDPACPAELRVPGAMGGESCAYPYRDYISLLPNIERASAFASGEYELSDHVTAFGELVVSRYRGSNTAVPSFSFNPPAPIVPANHIDNPWDVDLRYQGRPRGAEYGPAVAPAAEDNFRGVLGLRGDFGAPDDSFFESWQWELSAAFGVSRFRQSNDDNLRDAFQLALDSCSDPNDLSNCFNPFQSSLQGTGTPNSAAVIKRFSGRQAILVDHALQVYTAGITGSLFPLPGGDLGLAFGGEIRREWRVTEFDHDANLQRYGFVSGNDNSSAERDVYSGYAELRWPLLRGIELQTAVRVERYTDTQTTPSPFAALTLTPSEIAGAGDQQGIFQRLTLRANASRAFRAPSILDTYPGVSTAPQIFNVPTRPLPVYAAVKSSGNPDLKPETAVTVSGGLTWQPFRSLNLTADYWYYNYTDRIQSQNATRILLASDMAMMAGMPGDPAVAIDPEGNVSSVSVHPINIDAPVVTSGLDFSLVLRLDGADFGGGQNDFGQFGLGVQGTYTFNYYMPRGELPNTPAATDGCEGQQNPNPRDACNVVGKRNTPGGAQTVPALPRLKLNVPVSWGMGGHSLVATGHYINGFMDESTPSAADTARTGGDNWIPAFISLDLQYGYSLRDVVGKELSMRIGVLNVLDEMPPTVFGTFTAYEGEVHDPRGRMFYAKLDGEF
jgi:iron complex outermembrane recepter protein